MEPSDDVYRDWAVVEVSPRIYVGKFLSDADDEGLYKMGELFELVVVRGNVQAPDGTVGMMQQNMHTPLPLCTEGVTMWVKPNCIRHLKDLSESSRQEHITFIESAKAAFAAERMKKANITPATPGDLANLTRRRG